MTDAPDDPRVQHGEPPLTWLWDLYPLADGAWGNFEYPVAMFADWGGEPGSATTIRRWVTGPNGAAFLTEYTPADDYITEGYNGRHATYNGLCQDADRRCYVPQPEDLARVKSIFPNLPDPANPSWPQVEAELIAADRSADELRRMTAPALIRLLGDAHDAAAPPGHTLPWGRLVLWVAVLLILLSGYLYVVHRYGAGDNWLQKVGSLWWSVGLFVLVVLAASYFILGHDTWQEILAWWNEFWEPILGEQGRGPM
jgi:hypothetical protein